jgi:hypothetical protein
MEFGAVVPFDSKGVVMSAPEAGIPSQSELPPPAQRVVEEVLREFMRENLLRITLDYCNYSAEAQALEEFLTALHAGPVPWEIFGKPASHGHMVVIDQDAQDVQKSLGAIHEAIKTLGRSVAREVLPALADGRKCQSVLFAIFKKAHVVARLNLLRADPEPLRKLLDELLNRTRDALDRFPYVLIGSHSSEKRSPADIVKDLQTLKGARIIRVDEIQATVIGIHDSVVELSISQDEAWKRGVPSSQRDPKVPVKARINLPNFVGVFKVEERGLPPPVHPSPVHASSSRPPAPSGIRRLASRLLGKRAPAAPRNPAR